MPYSKNSELPDSIKNNLPAGAQTIFRKTSNSAHFQYQANKVRVAKWNSFRSGKNEVIAFKVAWSAVKKVYKKNARGKWVRK